MQDISNYAKMREDAHSFYVKVGSVRCPALQNELVSFTSEGFNHLMYKGARTERSKNDQVTKFKLLPKAKRIIEVSTTYQEHDEGITDIRRKKYKHTVQESAPVRYWGFVAIMDNSRVKVVVRQVGNGQKHFLSVIPAWRVQYYRNIKIISKAVGDLAND